MGTVVFIDLAIAGVIVLILCVKLLLSIPGFPSASLTGRLSTAGQLLVPDSLLRSGRVLIGKLAGSTR